MHVDLENVLRAHDAPEDLVRALRNAWAMASPEPGSTTNATLVADLGSFDTYNEDTEVVAAPPRPAASWPERYEDLGPLGVGGMGEVRRVRDRELHRILAMKIIKASILDSPRSVARFVEEAQCTAQLQHPGIVPVHDYGRLGDGRLWFTMKEVRGRTLKRVLLERDGEEAQAWTFRQVLDAYRRVCEAVGYAHRRGVVHRDLKPDNIMVGEHGEVLVLDWGLAKVLRSGTVEEVRDEDTDAVITERSMDDSQATMMGHVAGTPAFMPPEQAHGLIEQIDARSDVYALGAILYQILCGRRPYQGANAMAIVVAVRTVAPRDVDDGIEGLPEELVSICKRAMSRERDARYASAEELMVEIGAWLDGARKRDQAQQLARTASARRPVAERLRREADVLEAQATALLEGIAGWEPVERKVPGWARQDEAAEARRLADREEVALEQGLQASLRVDPRLPDAHLALAERYRADHTEAEEARDPEATHRAQTLLRDHANALPEGHPVRVRCASYLRGTGAVTLITDVPGARVQLFRFEERDRRLVAIPQAAPGTTPLIEHPLGMGSYLLQIEQPGHASVSYPVHIRRGHHWDGIGPDGGSAVPIVLPRLEQLAPDDCYVPAGWYLSGGDPGATYATNRRRLWVDAVVAKRTPVTNRLYLAFLDDLVTRGREQDALRWVPREDGLEGAPVYGRTPEGGFELVPDAQGDLWHPDWPVLMVCAASAEAYTAWLAEKTGLPWRLPHECEWEKAARGVDGRFYPWGDRLDPTFCCMRASHESGIRPSPMDWHATDTSVYGLRHTAGNAHDWCANGWIPHGSCPDGTRVVDEPAGEGHRATRGGTWLGVERVSRCAERWGLNPLRRLPYASFRPVRAL